MPNAGADVQPGDSPAGIHLRENWGEWLDRHSRTFFIAPAVVLILIFAIFPTIYSIVFALSRVRFTGEGLKFLGRIMAEGAARPQEWGDEAPARQRLEGLASSVELDTSWRRTSAVAASCC